MGSSSGRCENGHKDCTVIRCWVVAVMGMVGGGGGGIDSVGADPHRHERALCGGGRGGGGSDLSSLDAS